MIEGSSATVHHAGDTACFEGFGQVGERLAIDAALLPIGAYDPHWFMKAAHVDPEEALQAFLELKARTFLAVHWGTFKLCDEPLDEPPRLIEEGRVRRGSAAEAVSAALRSAGVVIAAQRGPRAPRPAPDPNRRPVRPLRPSPRSCWARAARLGIHHPRFPGVPHEEGHAACPRLHLAAGGLWR